MNAKKVLKSFFIILLCLALIAALVVLGINAHVVYIGGSRIITPEEAMNLQDIDCIVVLGCLVKNDGTPSDMLNDRLQMGINLYELGASSKIIMSGDHGRTNYDEVNTMKQFAIDSGIPSSDVFMDHAGFSTYETIYRAKEVFQADRIIIVTQEYHLYRALYIAEQLGIEAYGVDADYRSYSGQFNREIREILARNKDFIYTLFKPEPTYLGEIIPVSGNGDLTNDN